MEPGRGDRDGANLLYSQFQKVLWPQWSPVAVTGTTCGAGGDRRHHLHAAMEPGRGDRDDVLAPVVTRPAPSLPQRSPVAVTGTTREPAVRPPRVQLLAAMEPGHGDRVDHRRHLHVLHDQRAAMAPGRGDRDDDVAPP